MDQILFGKYSIEMIKYSSSPLSTVLLSIVLVTHGQPQSENIRWKIPEINNS